MPEVLDAPAAEAAEPMDAPETDAAETQAEPADNAPGESDAPQAGDAPETDAEKPEKAEDGKDIYAGEDGKKIPAKLAPVFKAHPELRAMFFENRELRALGGLKAVREQAQLLEEAGGKAGLEAVGQEIEAWNELDGLFSNGDPELARRMFDEDPEAAEKFAPALIEQFAERSPEAYSHIMGRSMLATMQGFGVYDALARLQQMAGDNQDVRAAFEPLLKFWNTVYDAAQKVPEKRVDPERQKLDNERRQFEQEREKLFIQGVLGDARGHMESAIETQLGRFFGQAGGDIKAIRRDEPDYFKAMVKECDERLARAINTDQAFQTNKSRFQEARDADGLKQLYRRKIESAMPDIAKAVHRLFTRGATAAPAKPKPVAAAPGAARPGANAVVRGTKPPGEGQIDFHRTPSGYSRVADAVLDGRAYLRGRKELYIWNS